MPLWRRRWTRSCSLAGEDKNHKKNHISESCGHQDTKHDVFIDTENKLGPYIVSSARFVLPLKVLPHMWQQWGRPSSCLLALWRTRAPFSVKRCSHTSQLKGRSPVCVRLCLSRLAGIKKTVINTINYLLDWEKKRVSKNLSLTAQSLD